MCIASIFITVLRGIWSWLRSLKFKILPFRKITYAIEVKLQTGSGELDAGPGLPPPSPALPFSFPYFLFLSNTYSPLPGDMFYVFCPSSAFPELEWKFYKGRQWCLFCSLMWPPAPGMAPGGEKVLSNDLLSIVNALLCF